MLCRALPQFSEEQILEILELLQKYLSREVHPVKECNNQCLKLVEVHILTNYMNCFLLQQEALFLIVIYYALTSKGPPV